VLVTGGAGYEASAEVYDPDADRFSFVGEMTIEVYPKNWTAP
jgi:hypothetical protein